MAYRPKKESRREASKAFAPFAEMERKYSSEEEVPIVRLEEPGGRNNKFNVVGATKVEQNRLQPSKEEMKADPSQSQSGFEASKLGNTKSVRRPIFSKEEVSNSSRISSVIDQSNLSAIDNSSRRKSNSKLRQLFNNSREKQRDEPIPENESKVFGESQLRAVKPAVGIDNRMVRLERKVV